MFTLLASEGSSTDHRSKAILLWKPTDVVQDDACEFTKSESMAVLLKYVGMT